MSTQIPVGMLSGACREELALDSNPRPHSTAPTAYLIVPHARLVCSCLLIIRAGGRLDKLATPKSPGQSLHFHFPLHLEQGPGRPVVSNPIPRDHGVDSFANLVPSLPLPSLGTLFYYLHRPSFRSTCLSFSPTCSAGEQRKDAATHLRDCQPKEMNIGFLLHRDLHRLRISGIILLSLRLG